MFNFFKKKSSKNPLSNSEIEQLRQELMEKKDEFRTLYNQYVEAGGEIIPEDILDVVTGGIPIVPSGHVDDWVPTSYDEDYNRGPNS